MAAAPGHAVLLGLPLFLVFRLQGRGRRHVVRRTRVCSRRRAGRRPDLADGASGASHERVGRWHADGHQWVITSTGWFSDVKTLIYFGSLGALSGFAFWSR
jgi:hypothetical protein